VQLALPEAERKTEQIGSLIKMSRGQAWELSAPGEHSHFTLKTEHIGFWKRTSMRRALRIWRKNDWEQLSWIVSCGGQWRSIDPLAACAEVGFFSTSAFLRSETQDLSVTSIKASLVSPFAGNSGPSAACNLFWFTLLFNISVCNSALVCNDFGSSEKVYSVHWIIRALSLEVSRFLSQIVTAAEGSCERSHEALLVRFQSCVWVLSGSSTKYFSRMWYWAGPTRS
jgi:hypothetical protein